MPSEKKNRNDILRTFSFVMVSLFMAAVLVGVFILAEAGRAHRVKPLSSEILPRAADGADKLLIMAHPDDETLWAGGHLYDKGFLVVCVTNGRNDIRAAEFEKVVKESGNAFLILEYPDKVLFKRDDWSEVNEAIKKDLGLIIGSRDWKQIATHNPEGEYGHEHHKYCSKIVTGLCEERGLTDILWYMGKYYGKSTLEEVKEDLPRLSDEQLAFKEKLLTHYVSQKKTIAKLSHMNPYENWKKYERD